MADPTEAQLQTIGAAVEMMRQFGSYDAEEHEDLHVSIALPIFTIDTDGIENDGFLHAAGYARDLHAVYVVCDGECGKTFLR